MKAVVYDGTRRVDVQQVPDAVVGDPGDVGIWGRIAVGRPRQRR
jgi:hypothetical protein